MKVIFCFFTIVSSAFGYNTNCMPPCNSLPIDPVCGSDGTETRSFSNDCQMKLVNCSEERNFQKVNDGFCKDESKSQFLPRSNGLMRQWQDNKSNRGSDENNRKQPWSQKLDYQSSGEGAEKIMNNIKMDRQISHSDRLKNLWKYGNIDGMEKTTEQMKQEPLRNVESGNWGRESKKIYNRAGSDIMNSNFEKVDEVRHYQEFENKDSQSVRTRTNLKSLPPFESEKDFAGWI